MGSSPGKQLCLLALLLATHCLSDSLAQNNITLSLTTIDWSVDFTAAYCVDGSSAAVGGSVVINMTVANEFINTGYCYKWVNGSTSTLCTQSYYFDFVFGDVRADYLTVYANNVVLSQSAYSWRIVPYANSAPSYIEVTVPVTATLSTGCSIKANFRPTPRSSNSRKYAGSQRQFSGSYQILTTSGAVSVSGAYSPANMTITGPRIQLASSSNATDLQAGDSTRVTLTVTRHSQATQNAINTFINVFFDTSINLTVTGFTGVTKIADGYYQSANMTVTSAVTTFATFDIILGDLVPLGKLITLTYNATYDFTADFTGAHYYTSGSLSGVQLKSPVFGISFANGPLRLSHGEVRSLTLSIAMPKGAVDLVLTGQFSSSAVSPIPVRLKQFLCSANASVTASPASLSETQMVTSNNTRARRAVTLFLTSSTVSIAIRNPSTGAAGGGVSAYLTFGIGSGIGFDGTGALDVFIVGAYSGSTVVLASETYTMVRPVLQVANKIVRVGSSRSRDMIITTTISHASISELPAYNMSIDLSILGMTVQGMPVVTYTYNNGSRLVQSGSSSGSSVAYSASGDFTPLINATTSEMVTSVKVSDLSQFTPDTATFRRATVLYYSNDVSVAGRQLYSSICYNCDDCVIRNNVPDNSTMTAGIVVLLFFIGLLIGAIIALLILILWFCCLQCRFDPESVVLVHKDDEEAMRVAEDKLVMARKDGKDGFKFEDLHPIKKDDSVLVPMHNETNVQVNRDLDTMDVITARQTDQELEDEFDQYRILGCRWLVTGMVSTGALTDHRGREVVAKFDKGVQSDLARIREEEKKERDGILDRLAKLNKAALALLLNAQRKQRNEKLAELKEKEASKEFVDDFVAVLDQQFEIERQDKIHQLRLDQETQLEQNREKFAARKREAIAQRADELKREVEESAATDEQANWYIKEHERVQARVDELHAQELGRQRLMLEEKLQRRRLMAEASEIKTGNDIELLNSMGKQQLSLVKKLKRDDEITPEKMDDALNKIKAELKKCKDAFDTERRSQRQALLEERNRRKGNLLRDQDEKARQRFEEARQQMEQQATQTDAADPVSCIQKLADLRASQRDKRDEIEGQLDEEDMQALDTKMEAVAAKSKAAVAEAKEALVRDLIDSVNNDADKREINKMLRLHEKELSKLQTEQEQQMRQQRETFNETLLKRREALEKRMAEDKRDKEEQREQERAVVREILNQQLAMSDEERERILREHERNMSMMEQNLTSNRIRQQRLLDEAYAKRKAANLKTLEAKQIAEKARQARRPGRLDSDEDDGEAEAGTSKEATDRMYKQATEKLQAMRGDEISLEEEMQTVQAQMMEEREQRLKEQEERLAAIIAQLQLEKAKEMAKIEEQQQAIAQLKLSLLDDLTDRRILSDDRCKEILQEHEEHLEVLLTKKEKERERQQRKMQEAMERRITKKQDQLMREQRAALEESLAGVSRHDKVAAQLRRAMIETRQAAQAEKFRKQLEWEMDQSLQESRRKYKQRIQEILQEEEFKFIGMLAKLGRFTHRQLLDLVCALFPSRSREDLDKIVVKMLPAQEEPQPGARQRPADEAAAQETEERAQMMLEKSLKFRSAMMGNAADTLLAIQKFKLSPKRKQQQRGQGELKAIPMSYNSEPLTPIDGSYRSRQPGDSRDFPPPHSTGGGSGGGGGGHPPPYSSRAGDLPPLDSATKKSKSKKKSRNADDALYEDEGALSAD